MDPITDRGKSVREVLNASRRFAEMTAGALEDLLTPELEDGRPLPDLVYVQQLAAAALDRRWRRLYDASETCDDAQKHHQALLGEREDDLALLYREVVDLRRIFRGRFGTGPSSRFLGLRGATSRDPMMVLCQADRAVARLNNLDRPLPAGKLRPSSAHRARWAAPVAEAADALRATVDRVLTAGKDLDLARHLRKCALEDFNRVFVCIAGWFEATYRLIGRQDLADLVRPSKQYPGLTYKQGKGRRRRPAEPETEPKAPIVRFPRLEPILRFLGSRANVS